MAKLSASAASDIQVGLGASMFDGTPSTCCRFCGTRLRHTFVDLGMAPLANCFVQSRQIHQIEAFYPIHVYVCEVCFLVQLVNIVDPKDIFTNYAYFSSYSDTWLEHCKTYTEVVTARFRVDAQSQVIEIGSNDGYLLQFFVRKGIPCLGIDPASNVAQVALRRGIPTLIGFFGEEIAVKLAGQGRRADLLVGNNVLGHVADLDDFIRGMKTLVAPRGVITLEFPHLLRLIEEIEFDTIYHEHLNYFTLITAEKVLSKHGLTVFDVEELATHGGSLRIYACNTEDLSKPIDERVAKLKAREVAARLCGLEGYMSFGEKVKEAKRSILEFMITAKREGKRIVAYGAPAKGTMLLNYCGMRTDFIEYAVDRSPHKLGHFLPGTRIPIYHPSRIRDTKPDYLLILAWNLKDEITEQMAYIREWAGRFVIPIPEIRVYA